MKKITKIPNLSSLIKKGNFQYVNSDISDSLFETPKEVSTAFKIYHFNRYISSENAVKEMEKDGYRPANAWELVKYAIDGWNSTDWVIGLGSVAEVYGYRRVPGLDEGGSERDLGLDWWDDDWHMLFRFLAVRNLCSETGKLEKSSDPLILGHLEKIEQSVAEIKKLLT